MIKRQLKRTRVIDWLVCGAFGVVALFFITVGVFSIFYGTTPEGDLIVATGIASNAEISTVKGRYGATTDFLWFSVGGYRVSFASDQDGYDRVLNAIRSGQKITIGISTKRETLLPRRGWVPLYTLSIGEDPILTYQSTISEGYRGSNAPFIIGGVLLAISSWGLYRCFTNRNLSRT
jgi:hypothetical protein